MPGAFGTDVLSAARRHDPHVPALFVTGLRARDYESNVEIHQPFRVLQKPFGGEALREAVQYLLD